MDQSSEKGDSITGFRPKGGPAISVVIPTRNRGHIIGKTLAGFRTQSLTDFEVLVVDDGGNDDTKSVVEALRDPRFTYHWAPHAGKSATRNRGGGRAKGGYVCFFDSDDLPGREHLSTARDVAMRRGSPPAFFLDFEIRSEDAGLIRAGRFRAEVTVRDRLLRGNLFPPGGMFLRADLARSLSWEEDPRLVTSEDWLIWLRLAARHPIPLLPGPTWALVDHADRTSRHWTQEEVRSSLECITEVLKADAPFMGRWGEPGLKRVRARMLTHGALRAALAGERRISLGLFLAGLKEDPRELAYTRTPAILKHLALSGSRSERRTAP